MQNILSGFLDSILGSSEPTSGTNRKYKCPFHDNTSGSKKLEIDVVTDKDGNNRWACWVCGVSNGARGRSIHSLLWKMGANKADLATLDTIVVRNKDKKNETEKFNGILPQEYVFLPDASPKNIIAKHAKYYLKKRGITEEDIYTYQIGFCDDGPYAERIIIPSYDGIGRMNFFIGRSFEPDAYIKYKYPEFSRDIIPFEMFINWDLPVILCEGGFDMIAIKRNAIPLLGKSITNNLKKKLISSGVKKIYVSLDSDALSASLKHCQELMSYGKKVYLVIPEGSKDPSEMGFCDFTRMIQNAKKLNPADMMKIKMGI